jgi:hypothetical protein
MAAEPLDILVMTQGCQLAGWQAERHVSGSLRIARFAGCMDGSVLGHAASKHLSSNFLASELHSIKPTISIACYAHCIPKTLLSATFSQAFATKADDQ